jgi:hypothetical protein
MFGPQGADVGQRHSDRRLPFPAHQAPKFKGSREPDATLSNTDASVMPAVYFSWQVPYNVN